MSREKLQGFLIGMGVGVLFACFFKPMDESPQTGKPNGRNATEIPANTTSPLGDATSRT